MTAPGGSKEPETGSRNTFGFSWNNCEPNTLPAPKVPRQFLGVVSPEGAAPNVGPPKFTSSPCLAISNCLSLSTASAASARFCLGVFPKVCPKMAPGKPHVRGSPNSCRSSSHLPYGYSGWPYSGVGSLRDFAIACPPGLSPLNLSLRSLHL